MQNRKTKTIRKAFKNKKELIKYILDAESDVQQYVIQVPTKQKAQNPPIPKKKEISGLWYKELTEQVNKIKEDVDELIVHVNANWWFTQIDSDSRYQVGRQAQVNKKIHEVDGFAQAIANSKHLAKLKKIKFVIIHPLLQDGFEDLVQVLNDIDSLQVVEIERPNDTETYYVQQQNWTKRLEKKVIDKKYLYLGQDEYD